MQIDLSLYFFHAFCIFLISFLYGWVLSYFWLIPYYIFSIDFACHSIFISVFRLGMYVFMHKWLCLFFFQFKASFTSLLLLLVLLLLLREIHIFIYRFLIASVLFAYNTRKYQSFKMFATSFSIEHFMYASPISILGTFRFYRQFVFDVVFLCSVFFLALFALDRFLPKLHFIAHLFIYLSNQNFWFFTGKKKRRKWSKKKRPGHFSDSMFMFKHSLYIQIYEKGKKLIHYDYRIWCAFNTHH